ncbi:MAG TPA: thiamine-phosphate kinase [Sphingomonadaceae bacterium]|nr:thiamine-phosphate kinase [Sphingomonadaceae bacterium]
MNEADFIAALRALATDPAARGLLDDAAVLPAGGDLVLTHDMLAEGVHFLPGDPAADVAWKLLAVNLSDLAGKGAAPRGVLLGYMLRGDAEWDAAFLRGLGEALSAWDVPLLGGDTVACRGPRVLSLTAIGDAPPGGAPSRGGACADDDVWVSGTIGDAGVGLRLAREDDGGDPLLLQRYRRPEPRLALGAAVASMVTAMMDVSDGLLIDLSRLAAASGIRAVVDMDALPLSPALLKSEGDGRGARLAAATAGDDYELLLTAPRDAAELLTGAAKAAGVPLTRIGRVEAGGGLAIFQGCDAVALPDRLGYVHG